MLKLRKNGRDSARRTSEIELTACAIAGEVRLRAEAVFVGSPSTTVGGLAGSWNPLSGQTSELSRAFRWLMGQKPSFSQLLQCVPLPSAGSTESPLAFACSVGNPTPTCHIFPASHPPVILDCVPGCTPEAPYPQSGNGADAGYLQGPIPIVIAQK